MLRKQHTQNRGCISAKCRICKERTVASWGEGFLSTVCNRRSCRQAMEEVLRQELKIPRRFFQQPGRVTTLRCFRTRLQRELLQFMSTNGDLPDFNIIGDIIEIAMLVQTHFNGGQRIPVTEFVSQAVNVVLPHRRDYHIEDTIQEVVANPRMAGFIALAGQIFQNPQIAVVEQRFATAQ